MTIKEKIHTILRRVGYDIIKFPGLSDALDRRKRLIANAGIDVILDVGANTGQFAMQLRKDLDYKGRIFSFEPMQSAFQILSETCRSDCQWEAFNFGLGDRDERREINLAGNSWSSSILEMLPSHTDASPTSHYVGRERIEIRTLDSIFESLCAPGQIVYLKIDTQGFERNVIAGAETSLTHIDIIQVEMSLVPLYAGELPFHEMLSLLQAKGYMLVSIEPGFTHERTRQLLQVDGVFRRKDTGSSNGH